MDGFRFDAAQQLIDESDDHILAAAARIAREAAGSRSIILIAEHEPQHATVMRSAAEGGHGFDGIFNEDFHHSCRVALTGVRDAYFSDYRGTSREWLATAQSGFLFQGQYYGWQRQPRGAPALDRPLHQFVCFLENHDQVANSAAGRRLIDLTSDAWWRAMSTLLLLGPWTPLLFQGQERGVDTPFRYFADHATDLQRRVVEGRRAFLGQFTRFGAGAVPTTAGATIGEDLLRACQLDGDPPRATWCARLYADLLAMRRDDPTLGQHAVRLLGAVPAERTLLLRYQGAFPPLDRLLVINLEPDFDLAALPEPIVAPPQGHQWHPRWCSEDPRYDGSGVAGTNPPAGLVATGHAATVFEPQSVSS
jgi:maltooligosyltrehalose trehalohydrolase